MLTLNWCQCHVTINHKKEKTGGQASSSGQRFIIKTVSESRDSRKCNNCQADNHFFFPHYNKSSYDYDFEAEAKSKALNADKYPISWVKPEGFQLTSWEKKMPNGVKTNKQQKKKNNKKSTKQGLISPLFADADVLYGDAFECTTSVFSGENADWERSWMLWAHPAYFQPSSKTTTEEKRWPQKMGSVTGCSPVIVPTVRSLFFLIAAEKKQQKKKSNIKQFIHIF